ncbi:hypothetical protein BHM03_00060740 [Ensete ventricosum]|nr:hypothetical protein BHM03_00060740 [Ensete ventricosum]
MYKLILLFQVPSVAFFFGICFLRPCISNMHSASSPGGTVILVGRKLLQVILYKVQDDRSSGVGTLLGWAMAAIYMGGRLPQICLNVCMNSGLNPLMFIFALTGNATYVGRFSSSLPIFIFEKATGMNLKIIQFSGDE